MSALRIAGLAALIGLATYTLAMSIIDQPSMEGAIMAMILSYMLSLATTGGSDNG